MEIELIAWGTQGFWFERARFEYKFGVFEIGPFGPWTSEKVQSPIWTMKIIMWVISLSLARIEARGNAKNRL